MQHLKEISFHEKVELVGEFNGMKTEITYRCLIHDQVWPALSGNIKQGHGLNVAGKSIYSVSQKEETFKPRKATTQ